jgi:hypothetical protein
MKHLGDEPLTDLTLDEFELIVKKKLKELADKNIIVGIEPPERSSVRGVPCFRVRILYGTHQYGLVWHSPSMSKSASHPKAIPKVPTGRA